MVQGSVAMFGQIKMVQTGNVFPYILIDVSYRVPGTDKYIEYSRKVTFSKYYDSKVFADINLDTRRLEDSMKTIARESNRVANYFEGGKPLFPFDEINRMPVSSLYKDLCSALGKKENHAANNNDNLEE